jgi:putative nucleotidyltransferase with HDIG domain
MEKRRRAERLIASLRWIVILLGMAAVGDDMPTVRFAALLGLVAAYNGVITYLVADPVRYAVHGRRLFLASRVLDTAVITMVVSDSGRDNPLAYLLYWFVLVSIGFVSPNIRSLAAATVAVLGANLVACYYELAVTSRLGELWNTVGVRSAVVAFGFLVSAYIAKSRSQDDLAADRGSYLHAILDCGARLTSLRSIHELALYVLKSAVNETGGGGGELLLMNEDTHELECEAFHATSGPGASSSAPGDALLRSYTNWVLSTGREFVVRTGSKTEEAADIAQEDDRSAMAVPLIWHSSSEGSSSVLGVLIVWGTPGEDFGDDALDILRIFGAIAGAAIVNLRLYTNLQKSFLRTLQSLANGLEARDEYTRGHSERVMRVASMIAEELGVPGENVESLKMAAQLHDIGKIGVPDAILRKAGKLTVEEWETMRRHPLVSEEICRPLGLGSEILFLIKHHHERIDGKGYPAGLFPQDQPLLQRILVVADSFDAMRSRRPYRDVMPEEELVGELNRSAGRTMDPTVVDALRRLMTRGDLVPVYEEHDRAVDSVSRASNQNRRAA